jgi:hypothetical protein
MFASISCGKCDSSAQRTKWTFFFFARLVCLFACKIHKRKIIGASLFEEHWNGKINLVVFFPLSYQPKIFFTTIFCVLKASNGRFQLEAITMSEGKLIWAFRKHKRNCYCDKAFYRYFRKFFILLREKKLNCFLECEENSFSEVVCKIQESYKLYSFPYFPAYFPHRTHFRSFKWMRIVITIAGIGQILTPHDSLWANFSFSTLGS